ncbi:MAG: ATP-grasp domain-containing protein [Methanomassiliicoccales archaeon]|jgi:succinyl-CoA synthetase beta subunit
MRLYETEGKELFRQYGIRVPKGRACNSPNQIMSCLDHLQMPVMVKAQVLAGGRGKAGGVVTAMTVDEAVAEAREIFNIQVKGLPVNAVLLEEMVRKIEGEIYLGITIDPMRGVPSLIVSAKGGIDIESVPPAQIVTWALSPFIGIQDYVVRGVVRYLGIDESQEGQMGNVIRSLWNLYLDKDCDLVEVNPLLITEEGEMVAADAKVILNDDAVFRHHEFEKLVGRDMTQLERRAKLSNVNLVQLDGEVAVVANGAGLTMATLDLLELNGLHGGLFVDLGGTDDPGQVATAIELAIGNASVPRPKALLVSVFGGITRCDTVAEGVIKVLDSSRPGIPMVVRLRGVNEDRAKVMLASASIPFEKDLEAAIIRLRQEMVE